ncbi:hypothetical protein AURDEDRAFT_113612 [Auricularia subglabra TFB-10046 SS5]|nr:hypothetical protein AURDEDRAFT_113612 [Auricularia subglabra TFB-10046 SS5]
MVALLGGGSGSRPSLRLQPYQSIFHLHPRVTNLGEAEKHELEVFLGQVTLCLPKPREVTRLVVKLVAHYKLALPGHAAEKGLLGQWECEVSVPRMLRAGEHSFAWSLKVPRSTTPYERCPFGTVDYRLVAVADSPSGALKTEQFMEVIAVPPLDSETSALNERIEGFTEEIGPYLMTLLSQHLTVGGVVQFSLNLASVPRELRLHSITATLLQSYTLTSYSHPRKTISPPPHRRPLFHIDHTTQLWDDGDATRRRPGTVLQPPSVRARGLLASLAPGGSLQVSHVARLPKDDLLRATTLPGSETPIRVAHTLALDVAFSAPGSGSGPRVLRTERPLTILSCGCLPESLVLPPYGGLTGETYARGKCGNGDEYMCICLLAFDALIKPLLGEHKALAAPAGRMAADEVFAANKRLQGERTL